VPAARAWALPLLGHELAFRSDKLGFLVRCARQADVVELRLGRTRTFLLSSPEDIRHVLVTEHQRFSKHTRLMRPVDPGLFGAALVGTPKSRHGTERRALQPVYHQERLAAFAGIVERCVDEASERWEGLAEVDLAREMVALAQGVRIRVLLGADADRAGRVLPAALEARQSFIAREFIPPVPGAGRLPSPTRRRYRRGQAVFAEVVANAISERKRQGGDASLLSSLLETFADGTATGRGRVLDEARTFLASYEVSSRALAWTLHLLAGDAAVQARLAAGAEPAGYEQMVFSEAIRLYPPSWLFVRMAFDEARLPSGHVVPAGSRLFLSPYAAHREPRHFPDPDRFDPERFRPGPALRDRPRYAYLPFGGGPHVCIGEGFARMEAAIVLPRLLRRAELALVPGRRVRPRPRVTLELSGDPRVLVSARRG
jgi:cytochrome P450